MSSTKQIVIDFEEWNTSDFKLMPVKVNDKGGKSINIISNQTKRSIHLSLPALFSFGISDFVNEQGIPDGKYSISLAFPTKDYETPDTDLALSKLKEFETNIIKYMSDKSEMYWGEKLELAIVKHNYFPFLKYSKDKLTQKIDYTRPPTFRAKVPNYEGKWNTELYEMNGDNPNLIFPCENKQLTPMDFVPKQSIVACLVQCSGVWMGGKGWGLTWKMIQGVVKPREVVSIYGKCHVKMTKTDLENMKKPLETEELPPMEEEDEDEPDTKIDTKVEDSDDETEKKPEVIPEPEPVVEKNPEPAPAPEVKPAPVVKKIVKKVSPPPAVVEPVVSQPVVVAEKKKIVKKVVAQT